MTGVKVMITLECAGNDDAFDGPSLPGWLQYHDPLQSAVAASLCRRTPGHLGKVCGMFARVYARAAMTAQFSCSSLGLTLSSVSAAVWW